EDRMRGSLPKLHLDAADDRPDGARRRRAPRGRLDRGRARVGEPGSSPLRRSGSVRYASHARGPPRLRDREPLLPRCLVRASRGSGVARHPPRPAAEPRAGPGATGRAPRLGVPRAPVDLRPVGRMRSARTPARAETVGSLLRPSALAEAVRSFYAEGHSAALDEERARDPSELREAEDAAIRDAVRRQIDIGLDVVTDGEFRR